jgi:glycosyltransferase involved in cell wall biosynthesis
MLLASNKVGFFVRNVETEGMMGDRDLLEIQANAQIDRGQAAALNPQVSVIIPAYGIAQFIQETLDSVFAQTFSDYEVIIVNDGSPDTEDFELSLLRYRERVVYIKQRNRGAAAARNRGLQEAEGQFVAFLDGDDLWKPNYLEEQVKFIKNGDYDLVYADALIVGDSPLAGLTFMQTAPSEGDVTVRNLLLAKCNVITSGVVARKQSILDAGLFDEELRNGSEDFDLWLRLAKRGARLAYQRKVLLRYRGRENSLSGDAINNIIRQLQVYDKFERSYDLSIEERADISGMVERLQAELELETGRLHLFKGNFADAREGFKKANIYYRTLKLRLIILFLYLSPRLLLSLYALTIRKPKSSFQK